MCAPSVPLPPVFRVLPYPHDAERKEPHRPLAEGLQNALWSSGSAFLYVGCTPDTNRVGKHAFPQPLIVIDGCLHELQGRAVQPSGRQGQERQHLPPLDNLLRGLHRLGGEILLTYLVKSSLLSSAASTIKPIPVKKMRS